MTNSEANNPSGLSAPSQTNHSWNWLAERLPAPGAEQLSVWIQNELEELEARHADLVTPRSLKRNLRHQFTSTKR